MKKFFKAIIYIFTFSIITIAGSASLFIYTSLKDVPQIEFAPLSNQKRSCIYDETGNVVEVFGETKEEYVEYKDIPPVLIQALISIEDIRFFDHPGVDLPRTFKAFLHNLFSHTKHGGSTITQQLIKNVVLTNEQTYKRKIQEAYLALKIEKQLSKEEILTLYFNSVYFEQSIPGVRYAARRYFGKDITLITLPEAALLAGIVKSASYYNPFKYPERIQARKNLVLEKMLEYGFIEEAQYRAAVHTQIADILIPQGSNYQEPTYRFQSYLDIVYLELQQYTHLDPYTVPLEIHTYLDSSLQTHLDQIQDGMMIPFSDDDQQIGASVVRNQDGALIGVIGGRNYRGARIFNRAYSLQRQPASTIKPVFGYLLAAEYLHYNEATNVLDAPYVYPGTSVTVQNADKNYAGYIPLVQALGYSKNTAALYTLEKVIQKIGMEKTIAFLENIGLMDEGPFAYPYGIGGMTYGTSPTALAGAYSVLMREGQYIKPSTISYIRNLETGEVIYTRDMSYQPLVSKESAFQIASTLIDVVQNNYYQIGAVRVEGVAIGAKTGTNGYDERAAKALGYPTSADKDSWLAGFSSDYSMAVWTGFDTAEKGDHHYFGKGDSRRQIPKKIFQNVMEHICLKKERLSAPAHLVKVAIVNGCEQNYLPNAYIPSYLTTAGYFYPNEIPDQVLPNPTFPIITGAHAFILGEEIQIEWEIQEEEEGPFDYTKIFGSRGFCIQYTDQDGTKQCFTTSQKIVIPYLSDMDDLRIIPCFENQTTLTGSPYIFLLE